MPDGNGSGYTVSDERPIADEKLVVEAVDILKEAFNTWVDKTIEKKGDVDYTTGLMIAQNLYKMVLQDIAEKTKMAPEVASSFYAQGLLRLSQALLDPDTSKEYEKERRKKDKDK